MKLMKINFSYTSFITSTLFFSFITLIMFFYIKRKAKKTFCRKEVLLLLCILGIASLRLIFPLELPMAKSIYITTLYADFCRKLRTVSIGSVPLIDCFVLISLVISFLIAFLKIFSYRKFYKTVRNGTFLKNVYETTKSHKKIVIPLIRSPYVNEVFIIGIVKPCIIIPENFHANEKYVIEHELQHYRNHDLIYKLLLEILTTVYWWNPIVYLLKSYIGDLFELRNDLSIINKYTENEKLEYAETLVSAAKEKKGSMPSAVLGICENRSFLKIRIHSILNQHKLRPAPLLILPLVFIVSSFFFVLEPSATRYLGPNHFTMKDEIYFIQKSGNKNYCLYVNGKFLGELTKIPTEFSHIKIIKEN